MAKYEMKAETGKFKGQLQGAGNQVPAQDIPAGAVVSGVVQMHNLLVHMTRALQGSNGLLRLLQANLDDKGYIEITVDVEGLEQVINANDEVLKGLTLD